MINEDGAGEVSSAGHTKLDSENSDQARLGFLKLLLQDWALRIAVVVIIVSILWAITIVTISGGDRRADLAVSALETVLAWPVMALLSLITFSWIFRSPISGLIDRIEMLRYKDAEARVGQAQTVASGSPPPNIALSEIERDDSPSIAAETDSPVAAEPTSQANDERLIQCQSELNNARMWWMYWWAEYINLFLVWNSKRILLWLAPKTHLVSVDQFHASWSLDIREE